MQEAKTVAEEVTFRDASIIEAERYVRLQDRCCGMKVSDERNDSAEELF